MEDAQREGDRLSLRKLHLPRTQLWAIEPIYPDKTLINFLPQRYSLGNIDRSRSEERRGLGFRLQRKSEVPGRLRMFVDNAERELVLMIAAA